MKLYKFAQNTSFAKQSARDHAIGIFIGNYSGSVYIADNGSVSGYETFADRNNLKFHV